MFVGFLDSFKPGVPKFVITGIVHTPAPHACILGQERSVNVVSRACFAYFST